VIVTSHDLGIEFTEAPWYPDFYLLSACDICAVSNSSFSVAACMLNEKARLFLRPSLKAEKLIAFDPWDTEVILKERSAAGQEPTAADIRYSAFIGAVRDMIGRGEIAGALEYYDLNRAKFTTSIKADESDDIIARLRLAFYNSSERINQAF
jgi:hypothetical protein